MRATFTIIGVFLAAVAIRAVAFAQVTESEAVILSSRTAITFGVLFTVSTIGAAAVGAWFAVRLQVVRLEEQIKFICLTLDRHEDTITKLEDKAK